MLSTAVAALGSGSVQSREECFALGILSCQPSFERAIFHLAASLAASCSAVLKVRRVTALIAAQGMFHSSAKNANAHATSTQKRTVVMR